MSDYPGEKHRKALEAKLGRKLRKGEVADHINTDKGDNNPANLRPMDTGDHSRMHTDPAKRHTAKLVKALTMVRRGEKLYP